MRVIDSAPGAVAFHEALKKNGPRLVNSGFDYQFFLNYTWVMVKSDFSVAAWSLVFGLSSRDRLTRAVNTAYPRRRTWFDPYGLPTAKGGILMHLAILLFFSTAVFAGQSTKASDRLPEANTWRPVIERLAVLIETRYPEPEVARKAAAGLRERARSGGYKAYAAPGDFAGRLTEELSPIDMHFSVSWDKPGTERPIDPAHDPARRNEGIELERRSNFGFQKVEILPGNIGYINLEGFSDALYAGGTAVAVMGVVAAADALIIDVRNNGGGEPSMVQLLISYLTGDEPIELMRFVQRSGEGVEVKQTWTLPFVPGCRLPNIPVLVLTSRRTGSAAEAIAYELQQTGRARIVGQTSAGGALPVQEFDLGDGFWANIPTARTVHPLTGTNWQTVGVKPDVEVPETDALATAQILALEALAPKAKSTGHKQELAWAREELEVSIHPRRLDPAEMTAFVGTYGDRRIWIQDGALLYQRASRSPRHMQALDADRFIHAGVAGFRTRFERDAKGMIMRLVDEWINGHTEAHMRKSD
ncbi:MAG: S41 family peptidase [Methanosarcinaceae archaeon]|nr:S41 family peptidase [Methanosarcinaceae archaeon]